MLEILAYILAFFAGFIMGLIGGGGSILTLPILVYLLGLNPIMATSYSLFIVGSTAFFGTLRRLKKQLIDFKVGILFAVPSVLTIIVVRRIVIPNLPDIFFQINDFSFTKELFIMLLFSIIMFLAGWSMIRSKPKLEESEALTLSISHFFAITTQAIGIGVLAGLVGAGGGFLIVPALVLLLKLPIKKAISTSLFIIAIQSIIGFFIGDFFKIEVDWTFLGIFTTASIVGVFTGISLSKKTSSKKLKNYFGYFTIVMALVILIEELFIQKL